MLTIQLLGGFKISQEGELIRTPLRPRGKSLLVYLLLHHATPQNRAHLAYTFWPETNDSQARTNLRRELHQLRQSFPLFHTLVKSDKQSVQGQSEPIVRVDVVQFTVLLQQAATTTDSAIRKHAYQAAIGLYHGDLLPGLYDEWLLSKREELRQAFIHALETLTTLLVDERAYTAAVTLCQRLLQYDPLYEAGYLQLMELYALQQDRAHSLHTYHSCVTILERELGVPPGEEIERLYQRLLYADERGSAAQRGSTATALQLIGRKAEWQRLLQTWRQASQGNAHAFLIEGEAGIGKTRLGEELLEWANRQAIATARTRAYAAEGSLAYTPVIEWLRTPPLRAAIADLDAPWRTELARLLPELLTAEPQLPRPEPLTERWQRQRLFEALARAVTVDARPKLLFIDWAAPTTGTHAAVGDGQLLPPKVYAVIQQRLAQLSPAARTMAALAATIGRSFTFDLLCAAGERGEDEVVNGLDELWRRKVIRERGANDYDFSHDRIREAAYAELSPMRRKYLHGVVARALESVYQHEIDTVSGQLALHHERAGNMQRAIDWYQRAGRQSWTIHAFRDAVGYQQTAIALLAPLPASKEALAKELALQLEFAESMAAVTGFTHIKRQGALLRARELAHQLRDLQILAHIIPQLSNLFLALGDAPQMHRYAEEANALVAQVEDPVQKARLYGAQSRILLHIGDFARAHELLREEIEIFQQAYHATHNPSRQSQYVAPTPVYALVQWMRGYPDQAQRMSEEYRLLSDQRVSPYHRSNVAFMTAVLHRNLGNDDVVAAEVDLLLTVGERYDLRMAHYCGNIFGGWLAAKQGNFRLAAEKIRYGLEGYKQMGHVMYHSHRLAMLVEVLLWDKQFAEAEAVLHFAFDIAQRCDQHFWDAELHRLQGDLLLAQQQSAEAAEDAYHRAITVAQHQGAKSLELRTVMALSRLWQRQGQTDRTYQTLAAIYGWFTEGFDTADLKAAKALLTQLST